MVPSVHDSASQGVVAAITLPPPPSLLNVGPAVGSELPQAERPQEPTDILASQAVPKPASGAQNGRSGHPNDVACNCNCNWHLQLMATGSRCHRCCSSATSLEEGSKASYFRTDTSWAGDPNRRSSWVDCGAKLGCAEVRYLSRDAILDGLRGKWLYLDCYHYQSSTTPTIATASI